MMVRLPSNRSLTSTASKSSAALNLFWGGVVARLRNGTRRPKFGLVKHRPGENPEISLWFTRVGADAAQSASLPLID